MKSAKSQVLLEERYTPPNSPKDIIRMRNVTRLTQNLPKVSTAETSKGNLN